MGICCVMYGDDVGERFMFPCAFKDMSGAGWIVAFSVLAGRLLAWSRVLEGYI